jgi:RHS repeat-associated protein
VAGRRQRESEGVGILSKRTGFAESMPDVAPLPCPRRLGREFAYDEAGELTLARWQQTGKERFGYDATGNMLFNREYDFTYGVGNRLLSYACDKISLTYDDDGNVTGKTTPDGTTQYRWDSENQLIGITKPDGTAIAYQYDELGRRVGKRVASQQWQWSYLGQGQEIHRENGPSGLRFYTHGSGVDEPLGLVGAYQYFVADGLGSIRQIVNLNGQVLNQYRYTAFGKMKQVQEAIGNTYTYTGREWDADAGLYYYRARRYDADVGRFMSEDPIGFESGDGNLYAYVENSPINGVDPSGLVCQGCCPGGKWSTIPGTGWAVAGGRVVGTLEFRVTLKCDSKPSTQTTVTGNAIGAGLIASGNARFGVWGRVTGAPSCEDLYGGGGLRLYGVTVPKIKKIGFSAVFITIAHSGAYYELVSGGASLPLGRGVPATAIGMYVKVYCLY